MRVQMNRVSLSLCSVVAVMVLSAAAPERVDAGMRYTVNGKTVSASTYQAFKIVASSLNLMKENRTEEAAAQLRTAVALAPEAGEPRAMLGMALARIGKTDEAAEQMRLSILAMREQGADDERTMPAMLNLAALYQSSGKTDNALEIYKNMVAKYPHSSSAPALESRVVLLEREWNRQQEAAERHRTYSNYYGDVIGEGRKLWPAASMPIKVFVSPGQGMPDWKPEYNDILHQSFNEWQDASHGKVRFAFVPKASDADITCEWIEDASRLESAAEGGEAVVQTLLESVTKGRVLLSLSDSGSAFPLTPNLVRSLCLHEIGHALGLMGHSARASDVLYCSTPLVDKEQHLSARDINTLNALYASDVSLPSAALAGVEGATHGNALNAMRFAILSLTTILAALIAVRMSASKTNAKKNQSATNA